MNKAILLKRFFVEHYILLYSGIFIFLLLSGVVDNFKLLTAITLLYFIALSYSLKNLLLASVLTSLFVFPLFSPNKYYIVEVIKGGDFLDLTYRGNDYLLGYGLNITNIILSLSILLLIREIITKKLYILKILRQLGFSSIIGFLGFMVFSVIANSNYSPFIYASMTWSLQYSQVFVVAMFIQYLYYSDKKNVSTIFPVVLSSVIMQSILSIWQFVKQSSIGLPIEQVYGTWFAQGLDENNAVLRVFGSLAFHNELALVSLIYLVVLLPHSLDKAHKPYFIGCVLTIITIILTQSRSAWIALVLILMLFLTFYHKEVRILWHRLDKKRFAVYGILFGISISYIIIPRILLSFNAVYEGAGLPIRYRLLTEGIQAFTANPWFGYGAGTNEYVLHRMFPDGVMSVFPTAQHVGLLQLALEVGIFGVAFFLLPFYTTLRNTLISLTRRSLSTDRKSHQFTFIAGILAFFVYYLFLPHVGIIEFNYVGLILGFGLIGISKGTSS